MNEKLPIEFREREGERESEFEFPREIVFRGWITAVFLLFSREPVHRYQRKTPVSSSLFSRTRPRGRGTDRLTDLSCVPCTSIPSSSFGDRGTFVALMQTIVSN